MQPADPNLLDDESLDGGLNPLQGAVRFLQLLNRRRHIVISAMLGAYALGVVYFALAPRYYESVAKLMITVQRAPDQVSSVTEETGSDTVMASQRELVRSSKVVGEAIEKLRPEHRIDLIDEPPRDWVESITERLRASTVRKTNHMEVRYRSRKPEAAAAVVESVIESYLAFVQRTHQNVADGVLAGHRGRLESIEASLHEKQARLQQLRTTVEALSSSTEDGVVDPVVSEAIHLHQALLEVRQERIQLQASEATLMQAMAAGQDVRRHLGLVQEAVGEQVLLSALGLSPRDAEIQVEQQKQLLAAEDELRRVTPYLGPQHPQTLALQERIRATREYLATYQSPGGDQFQAIGNAEIGPMLIEIIQQSVQQAAARERQLDASYRRAFAEATRKSSAIDELAQLQREVTQLEADRHAYDYKILELDDHRLFAPIIATIVEDPLPATEAASPRLHIVLLASTLAGVSLGCLVVYAGDLLDDRFGSPEEMSGQLGLPVLTLIGMLKPNGGEGIDAVQMHTGGEASALEAFRTLRTSLSLSGESCERLMISSAEPGDGKTTVSANLAVAYAQIGKRTLVIDADLRRPGLTALLDLKGQPGVTDLLVTTGSAAELADELVRPTGVEGLDIISAGPRRPDAAELLAGKNFADLLAWADSRYDQVLVDCPPVLAVSDAHIVGRQVDGVALVVSPEKNHRRLVVRACDSFHRAGVHVFGVVANRITDKNGKGYQYGYGYGYSYGNTPADDYDAQDDTNADALPVSWDELTRKAA